MDVDLNKKAADGMYDSIKIVLNYMEQRVTPSLKLLIGRRTAREQYILGLYYLAKGWLHTLTKLNEVRDIQAIMTCSRSLIEITVDLILLYKDRSNNTVLKMLHFDRLQKFKAAAELVKYYVNLGQPVPIQYQEIESFYKKKKYRIEKKKRELWPGNTRLQRWSGNNLLTDIKEADRLLSQAIKDELRVSLEEFHETEYRRLHWFVHGSGLAGFWNLPATIFHLFCALSFSWSCSLAMICVKIVLTEFNMTVVMIDLDKEWEKVNLARNVTILEQNPHFHSEGTAETIKLAKEMIMTTDGPNATQ
jgi:hypothetical protein